MKSRTTTITAPSPNTQTRFHTLNKYTLSHTHTHTRHKHTIKVPFTFSKSHLTQFPMQPSFPLQETSALNGALCEPGAHSPLFNANFSLTSPQQGWVKSVCERETGALQHKQKSLSPVFTTYPRISRVMLRMWSGRRELGRVEESHSTH